MVQKIKQIEIRKQSRISNAMITTGIKIINNDKIPRLNDASIALTMFAKVGL